MIIRLVRMHFRPAEVDAFLEIFDQNKAAIRSFPGCEYLELVRDVKQPEVMSTISHWRDETDLEAYRGSELFAGVWRRVRPLFAGRTEAHTFIRMMEVLP